MNNPIKISMLSSFGPEIRGISPYSDGLSNALEKNKELNLEKHDYRRAYPEAIYPTSGSQLNNNNFATIHYAAPSTWRNPVSNRPDILHMQYWSPVLAHTQLGITRQAKKLGIPVVLTLHNATQHEAIPFFSWLEKKLLLNVDHIIVHTEAGKDSIIKKMSFINNKISVIPHGIEKIEPSTSLNPTMSDYQITGLSSDYNYLLYFGNIRHYKGVDILLDAWKIISHKHPNTKLIIAGRCWSGKNLISKFISNLLGNRKYTQELLRHADQGKPDNTIYKLDFIDEDELIALIRIARYSVFPYRKFNAQSGAASKSCSAGTPIICSKEGGLPLLAIDSSYVCDNLTSSNFSVLIDEKLSSWSENIASLQINKIKPYYWPEVAQKHIELYKKILLSE